MKRKKLLNILDRLLDMGGRKQREHRSDLKMVLKKLKKKKKELQQEMSKEEDARKLNRLGKELEIVDAQRLKGLKALKDLGHS
jgi:predicted  nucleic acid-binding Zn-ribbon protein